MSEDHDIEKLAQLKDALDTLYKNKNKISVLEFKEFEILFKKFPEGESPDPDLIANLTRKFQERFDLYENIEIYDPDNKANVLILPRIFMPIKDISEENITAVQKFAKDGVSEIPKYAAAATKGILEAILSSQASSEEEYLEKIKEFRNEYKNINLNFIRSFLSTKYTKGNPAAKVSASSETKSVLSDDDFSWENS